MMRLVIRQDSSCTLCVINEQNIRKTREKLQGTLEIGRVMWYSRLLNCLTTQAQVSASTRLILNNMGNLILIT